MTGRLLVFLLVAVLLSRWFWRIVRIVIEQLRGGQAPAGPPREAVQMVRDPVCGTFVLPEHAVALSVGRDRVYFCSEACRDKYRARTA